MEPMNLGTPTNSGPSSPATTPSGSPFLPSFLLGEPSTPASGSTSPQIKRANAIEYPNYASPRFLISQASSMNGNSASQDSYYHSDKTSGPPIRGLFDTVTSPVPNKVKQTNSDANSYISNVTRQFHDSSRISTSMQETADTTWVTVFGYPPAAAGFILSQLASCGNIVSRQVPANGNWMHVQFSSRVEAKRALASNGKVFGNSVMVGVVPCRDSAILDKIVDRSCTEAMNSTGGFASPTSPRSTQNTPVPSAYGDVQRSRAETSVYESPYGSPRSARPLSARLDNEVFGKGSTPQKSSGVVSKAMEYILGW